MQAEEVDLFYKLQITFVQKPLQCRVEKKKFLKVGNSIKCFTTICLNFNLFK